MKIKLIISLFLSLFSISLLAETLYISDKIKVWSRKGPSTGFHVKYEFEPGEQLAVLQKDKESGFIEVKDQTGRTAWVDSKLLTATPTAHQKLQNANNEIAKIVKDSAEKLHILEKKIHDLTPLEILNQELQTKLAYQESELEQLRQKSQVYESGFNSEATITGAVIILSGMFLGWLLSKLGGSKRHSGWS